MRNRIICAVLCLLSATARAGDVDLRLVNAAGQPVADAVVTVRPAGGIPRGPISFPWGTAMVQQNISFNPHVLIVPVGATVKFPNKDKVRHHVYSFSKPAKFEIKLFSRDETRAYTFTTAGAVALGCNIHDSMSGFIKVVDTPFAARSDAQGRVHIAGVPAGQAQVVLWHPGLRAKDNEQAMAMPIPASGAATRVVTLAVRG